MERGDTQRGNTHVEETTQGGDYTERGKETHTERRLHGEGREETYTERGHTRRGVYTERGLHGEGRGTHTKTEHTRRRNKHREGTTQRGDFMERGIHGEGMTWRGEGTTWRGERGHTRRGDIHEEETTRRRERF